MRRLMMGSVLLLYPLYAQELSVDKIEKMVTQIQGKRTSRVEMEFAKVASPFAQLVQEDVNATPVFKKVEQQVTFFLGAIVNRRANINGLWVGVGDTISGYKVKNIWKGKVVLEKAKRRVELFLPKPEKNNFLQFSEG